MFIIRVTSYASVANSILQIFFKSAFCFPKACSVLVSILIWIQFQWRRYQIHIFIFPLPRWVPSCSVLSKKCLSPRSALWLSQPKVFSPQRHSSLIVRKSFCPASLPQLWPSPLHTWERLIPLWVLLSGQKKCFVYGVFSTHRCPCPNGC